MVGEVDDRAASTGDGAAGNVILRQDGGTERETFGLALHMKRRSGGEAELIQRLEDQGVTDIITVPWLFSGVPMQGGSLQGRIDGLKRFADSVMGKMK